MHWHGGPPTIYHNHVDEFGGAETNASGMLKFRGGQKKF